MSTDEIAPKCPRGHTKTRGVDKNRPKGWRWVCRKCARPADRSKVRDYMLKHRYGITHDDYLVMLEQQDGVCAICRQKNKSGRQLHIDHNHSTGEVRGLLCEVCNTKLGAVEDPEMLRKFLEYLDGRKSCL